jgi:thiosulfate/3-mercaptopyruvate sulfurtransferase
MTSSALISVDALSALLRAPRPPVLLDVRWRLGGPPGLEEYRQGHLPGACFLDLDRDLADPPGPGGRHPLPAAPRFQATMRRAGVRADTGVVVYDGADSTTAARAWWLLRYFGHPDVRVLDGGYQAWVRAGAPSTTEVPAPRPGDFSARPGRLPALDADGAAALASSGLLLDARAAARYRGKSEPVDPVAGHIPGAVNAPTTAHVDEAGRYLPVARLRESFTRLGAGQGTPLGAYCGSGVTAAHTVLALEVAGLGPAALYPGSWSHWITDPARPVATGA